MTPPPIKEELFAFLRRLGFKPNSFHRIRFGGVVGKMTLLGSTALLAAAVVAFKAPNQYILWGCLALIALVFYRGIGAISSFAEKNPVEATLEGSEIVALKGLESQFAAKDLKEIPDQLPIARTLDLPALKPPKEGGNV